MIAIDTETTGVDLRHASAAFFVTTCDEAGDQRWWEFDVDPKTRAVEVPEEAAGEIAELVFAEAAKPDGQLVFQNSKFDVAALVKAVPALRDWPWEKTVDTLIAGHLLASNHDHSLDALSIEWLGFDIRPYEAALKEACVEARKTARLERPKWLLAGEGVHGMPSVKPSSKRNEEKPWKADTWLPRQLADELGLGMKVISGGQNGVDQAGLFAARAAGFATGGTAPGGWRTLDGPAPWLASYGLKQDRSSAYPPRTFANAAAADLTIQLYEDPTTAGERLTVEAVRKLGRRLISFDLRKRLDPATCARVILAGGVPKVVNVAGNSEQSSPGIGRRAEEFLVQLLPLLSKPHPWRRVLVDYANADSAVTLAVWKAQAERVEARKLGKILAARMRLPRVVYLMEDRGVALSAKRLDELCDRYGTESKAADAVCRKVADRLCEGHEVECPCVRKRAKAAEGKAKREAEKAARAKADGLPPPPKPPKARAAKPCEACGDSGRVPFKLDMPSSASPNGSLKNFCFKVMGMPGKPGKKSKSSAPSLEKAALEAWLRELDKRDQRALFVKKLLGKRSLDTARQYMAGYRRFWKAWRDGDGGPDWMMLHPFLNPTGTHTLRFSGYNPNEQNISKKEDFNVRYCFGPPPGYEWWALDAANLELRIPAYESGEAELIALFERPNDPPFYGSNHMLVFSVLWPEQWAEAVREAGFEGAAKWAKKRWESTYYKWTKNGNFAVQYGAGDETADAAYHQLGARRIIKAKFSKLTALNEQCIKHAERFGFVTTMPDRDVDPERGYPLLCTRTDFGKVLSTVPLNYRVQGTAMWWMSMAMLRCQDQLDEWRDREGFDAGMVMQVHDELDFEMPTGDGDPREDLERERWLKARGGPMPARYGRSNLWRVRRLQKLMQKGGDGIGVPTPVSVEWHPDNWSEGIAV